MVTMWNHLHVKINNTVISQWAWHESICHPLWHQVNNLSSTKLPIDVSVCKGHFSQDVIPIPASKVTDIQELTIISYIHIFQVMSNSTRQPQ